MQIKKLTKKPKPKIFYAIVDKKHLEINSSDIYSLKEVKDCVLEKNEIIIKIRMNYE